MTKQLKAYKSVRKPMPPPTKVEAGKKGKDSYRRKPRMFKGHFFNVEDGD